MQKSKPQTRQCLSYDVEGAMQVLCYSRSRYYKLLKDEHIRSYLVGSRRMVTHDELAEHVARAARGEFAE